MKAYGGVQTPFIEAYNSGVGVRYSRAARAEGGSNSETVWPAVRIKRTRHAASNADALRLGVIDKHGNGDGSGLGLAGSTSVVLELLAQDPA